MTNNPKRMQPIAAGWWLEKIDPEFTVWRKGLFKCLSSVVYISDEHLPPHWEWLISFSYSGKTLNDNQVKEVLNEWGALEFEEDNHERGVVRKFWLAVEHRFRKPCPCKDEKIITEGNYSYSQKIK